MTTVDLPAVPAEQTGVPGPPDHRARYTETIRAFRPRRTIPAAIVAAVLAAGSLLIAAEVISRLVDRPLGALPVSWLSRLGRDTSWGDPLALALAGLAIALGLLLLALAFWPGRARVVPLAPPEGAGDAVAAITRAGLARHAAAAADRVDGVGSAAAAVRRGRVKVRADSPLHDPQGIADQVREAVAERIDALAPLRPLPVVVEVRAREDGS